MGIVRTLIPGCAGLVALALAALPAAADPDRVAATRRARAADQVQERSPERATLGGFRMEGQPEFEVVFGDIDHFRAQVDRFYDLHERMSAARERFQGAVHQALVSLSHRRRGCPVDELALPYLRAQESGDEFRRLGTHFELTYQRLRDLDRLGESAGLTPDYRWKVNRATSLYRRSLVDLEEMRGAFVDQLGRELTARRCRPATLLARARTAAPELAAAPTPAADEPSSAAPAQPAELAPAAPTATFFVDNRQCAGAAEVYVDGTLLGRVAAGKKAAFQALTGRHSLCLIDADGALQCGETGTVRTAFLHDGWSLARHCQP